VDGQLCLGWSEFRMPKSWESARQSFDRARELAPGDSRTIYSQGLWTAAVSHPKNAIPVLQQAIDADPLNPRYHFHLGKFHWWCDDFDQALANLKTCMSLSPGFTSGHARLSLVYVSRGALDDALKEARKESEPGYRAYALAIVYHAMGRTQDYDDVVSEINSPDGSWACQMAIICGFRNETDAAFRWLDKAATLGDTGIPWLKPHILLRGLHSDPRWPAFLKKIGLTVDA
jgi:adenylate cyclase